MRDLSEVSKDDHNLLWCFCSKCVTRRLSFHESLP